MHAMSVHEQVNGIYLSVELWDNKSWVLKFVQSELEQDQHLGQLHCSLAA